MSQLLTINRTIKRIIKMIIIGIVAMSVIIFCGVAIAHMVVFSRADYDQYDSDYNLVYDDIDKEKYPREQLIVQSGENDISAFLYMVQDAKGLIVVAPGHRDANDIKLYEIRYFVDAGYSVVCLDYTGCYTSSGNSMKGYSQSVYDIDALLDYIEADERFENMPICLFGHSMGAYAVCAELQFEHDIAKVVAASGFDTPEEQWQYSIKRYTGIFYPIIKPFNLLFIDLKYGDDKDLSAVDGINSVSIPVLVISAEEDLFYGGKSPIYDRQNEIMNPNCTFVLMDEENHNGHYDYFLTDAALEYAANNPIPPIDKELYREHDVHVMDMIIEFFDS
ncbi:MAG: alpha/beta hydrolase [Lachnospiraceae bacterium]|nr:alpha/beta hydrolase [Lachnospiraceae bacterium]